MSEKIRYSIINAQNALKELHSYLGEPIRTARDRAGVIQAFEFSFETIWKLLQKLAEADGLAVNSPREAFTFAFQKGFVRDQNNWLAMIKHRNLTSHVYREEVALEVFEAIKTSYASEWDFFMVCVTRK
jgi:nucleotidyltransferase substrate binding protein (TIGR01987 family)